MGAETKIQWADHTFNPWVGCTKVHTGCTNCYAEADMDKRRHFAVWGQHGTRVKTSASNWNKPRQWNAESAKTGNRRRVFCASLADVFEDWTGPITNHEGQQLYVSDQERGRYPAVPFVGLEALVDIERQNIADGIYRPATMNDLRRDLFDLIDQTPHLDWLLLTKRPENVRRMWHNHIATFDQEEADIEGTIYRPNIWLGTSISDQATADKAVPELLGCDHLSRFLFVSVEPLTGPVTLTCLQHDGLFEINSLTGAHGVTRPLRGVGPRLNWVIVGGESGPQARPCAVEWIRSIVNQCSAAAVPCFVKQLGAHVTGLPHPLNRPLFTAGPDSYVVIQQDKKGGDPEEWPENLRIRQVPGGDHG